MRRTLPSLLLLTTLLLGACSSEFGGNYFAPTAALVCGEVSCAKIPESKIADQLTSVMANPESAKPFHGPQAAANRADAEREILGNLIRDEVALQRARRMNITVAQVQPDADATLKDLKSRFASEKAFNAQLKAEGLTLPQLKDHLIKSAMLKKVQADVGKGSEATDAEVEQFYNQNKSQYDAQINLSHVLVCANFDAQKRVCNQTPADDAMAADLVKRARAGEDFGSLAKQYSVDETSKAQNGSVGWISKGDLVPELERVAFNMQPGDISEPIKTQFGLHILKLNSIGKPLDAARKDIADGLTQRKLTKAFDEWLIAAVKAAQIKVNAKLGKYDPIAQTVVPLVTKAPAPAASPQPVASPDTSEPSTGPGDSGDSGAPAASPTP